MGRPKLAKIDLSKYNSVEKLPGNIISIIKNAICFFEGNTTKVAKHYNLDKERIDLIFEEYYLQLIQIIESQTKSKELDTGISNAITLMSDHINSLEKSKTSDTMTSTTIHNLTKMTDRLINLKSQFNSTYDTLINKMNDQALKARQIEVLENGKPEDSLDYNENQNTVAMMLKEFSSKKEKKITMVNIKTYETKIFYNYKEADEFLGTNGHLRDVAARKYPYKETWLVNMDEYYDKEK